MTLYRQWHAKAFLITYANNKGADQTVHEKTLKLKISVEAIQIHFVTNFACETRHIRQALHVGVFKRVSNPTTKVST